MRFSRRPWELREHEVTPEHRMFDRRRLLGLAAGGALGLVAGGGAARAGAGVAAALPAAAGAFRAEDGLTPETIAGAYNNFYEFGFSKSIAAAAKKLPLDPWRIVVDGLVDTPFDIDLDDLVRSSALEERIYRLRCVEAWSMVIPWSGLPLAEIVRRAGPKAEAKYVRFESFLDPKSAPMQGAAQYPWPYVEGVTIEEATNALAFLAVGVYGKPLSPQHGAPVRLVLPWKYGFKSAKSIRRISFVDKPPKTFWMALGEGEYGFYANVNPKVAHPRWSQASERRIAESEALVPTRLFNGYEAEVGELYKGREKEKIWF